VIAFLAAWSIDRNNVAGRSEDSSAFGEALAREHAHGGLRPSRNEAKSQKDRSSQSRIRLATGFMDMLYDGSFFEVTRRDREFAEVGMTCS
jgi:hypothetical protein